MVGDCSFVFISLMLRCFCLIPPTNGVRVFNLLFDFDFDFIRSSKTCIT